MNKFDKNFITIKLFMGWILLILILICYAHCSEVSKTSKIQKIINTHNSVKESDKSYPIVRKSPSSQKTVIGQDSIRIIPTIDTLKVVNP